MNKTRLDRTTGFDLSRRQPQFLPASGMLWARYRMVAELAVGESCVAEAGSDRLGWPRMGRGPKPALRAGIVAQHYHIADNMACVSSR